VRRFIGLVILGNVKTQMTARERLVRKAVDDVLGGEATWRDADSTSSTLKPNLQSIHGQATDIHSFFPAVACPSCDNDRAYFYQLQIRSADEPMTTCGSLCIKISSSGYDGLTKTTPCLSLPVRYKVDSAPPAIDYFISCTACTHQWRDG
jgi:DNA-directed RNA polymerase subunit M/transcription elongation factor TFIIS